MNPNQSKRHERWRAMRASGRAAFIARWGILYWGGCMFLIMGLLIPWIDGNSSRLEPRGLAISALATLVGGLLWGVLTWHFSEKTFLRNENRAHD